MGRGRTRTPQLAGPQQGLPMTIRGGGNPKLHMVLRTADVEWAPPPRSFATDAHAASWSDPLRSTAYKSAARPSRLARRARLGNLSSAFGPTGNSSPDPAKPAARARDRQGQVASRWPAATLDRHCARRPVRSQVGTRRWVTNRPNEEMRKRTRSKLDNHRPIQV